MAALLSSDILEDQFGLTAVEILRQDEMARIICTKVVTDGQVLELSRTVFKAPGMAAFADIHKTVLGGASMGKAFMERGIQFERQVRGTYTSPLPPNFAGRFGADGLATIIEVSIVVGADAVPYADILEVYSPVVAWPTEGAIPTAALAEQISALDRLLTRTAK